VGNCLLNGEGIREQAGAVKPAGAERGSATCRAVSLPRTDDPFRTGSAQSLCPSTRLRTVSEVEP